ncbi:MAG: ribosome small subunit-dependent GTPase A [Candidatus Paceibacterota bacterium]
MKEINNTDLGYNEQFESNRKSLELDGFAVARVIAEYKGAYKIKNENGEYFAKLVGKKVFDAKSREDYPAVGDWVVIKEQDSEWAIIKEILPRQSLIKRKHNHKNGMQIIATNIDIAFVVESIGRDFNLNRFERYFAIASEGGVETVIILNKIDLISQEELEKKLVEIKDRFKNIDIVLTSALEETGLDILRSSMNSGKTYCFLGSSGVGKSSLINKLLETNATETGDINLETGRGKHTTTVRQMYFLKNGAIVIDNPGMREVGMTNEVAGLDDIFNEILEFASTCKFVDCAHVSEPKCGVLEALESGALNREKYQNYLNLKKEIDHYGMTEMEKNEKDYKFGKFIKNAKKDIKNYKN